jgi:hypothetical protein
MLSLPDWIAVVSIAAPLIAKAFSDWAANAVANHNAALARVVGMAGREAATIARTLAETPTTADVKSLEKSLVHNSAVMILDEMGSSSQTIGADATKLTTIVQGEVNKLVVAPAATGK